MSQASTTTTIKIEDPKPSGDPLLGILLGVFIPLIFIVFVAILVFFYLKNKRRQQPYEADEEDGNNVIALNSDNRESRIDLTNRETTDYGSTVPKE